MTQDNDDDDKIMDLPDRFLAAVRDQKVTIRNYDALETLSSGDLPPHMIASRDGPGGQKIKYVKHNYATRMMNDAFRWLWDYEGGITVHVGKDGSVATVNRLTLHCPTGTYDATGNPIYHKRVVQEIGSFEAYPMKKQVQTGTKATGEAIMVTETVKDDVGNIMYTMSEADRIASSVSRGLVKCMARMFNLGIDLMDRDGTVAMTFQRSISLLIVFGQKQGLSEDLVRQTLREGGYSKDNLVDRFETAYRLIKAKAEALTPDL